MGCVKALLARVAAEELQLAAGAAPFALPSLRLLSAVQGLQLKGKAGRGPAFLKDPRRRCLCVVVEQF